MQSCSDLCCSSTFFLTSRKIIEWSLCPLRLAIDIESRLQLKQCQHIISYEIMNLGSQ